MPAESGSSQIPAKEAHSSSHCQNQVHSRKFPQGPLRKIQNSLFLHLALPVDLCVIEGLKLGNAVLSAEATKSE